MENHAKDLEEITLLLEMLSTGRFRMSHAVSSASFKKDKVLALLEERGLIKMTYMEGGPEGGYSEYGLTPEGTRLATHISEQYTRKR